jgi:hypothetical protein
VREGTEGPGRPTVGPVYGGQVAALVTVGMADPDEHILYPNVRVEIDSAARGPADTRKGST